MVTYSTQLKKELLRPERTQQNDGIHGIAQTADHPHGNTCVSPALLREAGVTRFLATLQKQVEGEAPGNGQRDVADDSDDIADAADISARAATNAARAGYEDPGDEGRDGEGDDGDAEGRAVDEGVARWRVQEALGRLVKGRVGRGDYIRDVRCAEAFAAEHFPGDDDY